MALTDQTGTGVLSPEADAADAPDDAPPARTFTEAELNARMAKLRKETQAAKRANEDLQRQLEEIRAAQEEKENAGLSEVEKLKARFEREAAKTAAALAEHQQRAETERMRRHELLKRSAILDEVSKRGLYEPDLIAEILGRQLTVQEDDSVVFAKGDDVQTVSEAVDAFVKARPRFAPPPAPGSGSKPGAPRVGRKSFAEMSGGELEEAAAASLMRMVRNK